MTRRFIYACPSDRSPLQMEGDHACCPACGRDYTRKGNIWRLLDVASESYRDFLDTYRVVRHAEGWGSQDASYYQTLPEVARDDPHYEVWRVRARSFKTLVGLLAPSSRLLDAGAGNGWLSYQCLKRGHSVAAVDLNDDERDGLGAHRFYPLALECIQADMHQLPFTDAQFDAIILNASLHYTTDLAGVLAESLRVLCPDGKIIVMDSPIYERRKSGTAMLETKAQEFKTKYGFEMTRRQRGFFTFEDFEHTGLDWEWHESVVDLRSAWRAASWRWRGLREPARFGVMVGRRVH